MSGMIEVGIGDKLQATAAVTALVPASRIYTRLAEQIPAYPFVVVTKAPGQTSVHCASGPSGLAMGMVMVRCYAATYAESRDVAEQVKLALDGQRGAFGSVNVRFCLLEDEMDISTLPQTDDEVGYPGFGMTFHCAWVNPTS